jgi:hypothetical protein
MGAYGRRILRTFSTNFSEVKVKGSLAPSFSSPPSSFSFPHLSFSIVYCSVVWEGTRETEVEGGN